MWSVCIPSRKRLCIREGRAPVQSKSTGRNPGLRQHQRSAHKIFAALTRPELSNAVVAKPIRGEAVETIAEELSWPAKGSSQRNASFPNGSAPLGQRSTCLGFGIDARTTAHSRASRLESLDRNELTNPHIELRCCSRDLVKVHQLWQKETRTPTDPLLSGRGGGGGGGGIVNFRRTVFPPERGPVSYRMKRLLGIYSRCTFAGSIPHLPHSVKNTFSWTTRQGGIGFVPPSWSMLYWLWDVDLQPGLRSVSGDPIALGELFYLECQHLLLLQEDHHKIPMVQALGILSIRERKPWSVIREADTMPA